MDVPSGFSGRCDSWRAIKLTFCAGRRRSCAVRTSSIAEPHLHVIADDARFVFGEADARILHEMAGRHIVLPAVPGAGDHCPAEAAFGERTAAMETDVVDRMKDAADVEEPDHSSVDGHEPGLSRRDVARMRDRDEVGHAP